MKVGGTDGVQLESVRARLEVSEPSIPSIGPNADGFGPLLVSAPATGLAAGGTCTPSRGGEGAGEGSVAGAGGGGGRVEGGGGCMVKSSDMNPGWKIMSLIPWWSVTSEAKLWISTMTEEPKNGAIGGAPLYTSTQWSANIAILPRNIDGSSGGVPVPAGSVEISSMPCVLRYDLSTLRSATEEYGTQEVSPDFHLASNDACS